ncbi:MAG: glycosyltransferase family 2 protein [Fimbriimonadaceae bacterium]
MPCFNNEATIARAIASLRGQTIPLGEVFVVDDGSTDGSAAAASAAGARVIGLGANRGRGAARAVAFDATTADLLLSVDGTGELAPDFLELMLPWFDDPRIAAVYGRITQGPPRNAAERWRGRHLYKTDEEQKPGLADSLITWAFVARPAVVREVGNFDASLRHSEDRELGERLLGGGWRIGYEPRALITTRVAATVAEVLERYWRWHAGVRPRFNALGHVRFVVYAIKVLIRGDLAARDFSCALISLLLPHYCAWRTVAAGK